MKKILFLLLLGFAFATHTQAQIFKPKEPVDPKYLTGKVPVVDGVVTFSRTLSIPATADVSATYTAAKHWLGNHFRRKDVLARKNLAIDTAAHYIKVGINEYIVFTDHALALDRSQMIYSLAIGVETGKVTVTMSDITYYYEEERDPIKYEAEEWITDEVAVNKKGTKLKKQPGKFRRLTIDTFDNICTSLQDYLTQTK